MHFWRIQDLRQQLQTQALKSNQAIQYAIAWLVLTAVVTDPFFYDPDTYSPWSHVYTAVSIILGALGTYYCYRCNGGSDGTDFLGRYFSITWVIAIRIIAITIPLFAAAVFIARSLDILPEIDRDSWFDILWFSAIYTLFWWRSGAHIRELGEINSKQLSRPIE